MKSNKNTKKLSYGEKKINKIRINNVIEKQFEEIVCDLRKNLFKINEINAVILFGSFARGDFSARHSDIDIMVILSTIEKCIKLEEKIRKNIITINLGKELNIHTIFQYKKIEDEDKSLMKTIADEGKVLFSRGLIVVSDTILGLEGCYLIRFDTTNTKPVIKNKLQRFLYGYTINKKHYHGIIDGEKVLSAGKGAIIVPREMLKKVLIYAKEIGVNAVQKAKFYR